MFFVGVGVVVIVSFNQELVLASGLIFLEFGDLEVKEISDGLQHSPQPA